MVPYLSYYFILLMIESLFVSTLFQHGTVFVMLSFSPYVSSKICVSSKSIGPYTQADRGEVQVV